MNIFKIQILKMTKFSGLNYLYRKMFSPNIVVLMYHGIAKDHWSISDNNWLHVRESEFRTQMEFLNRYYDVVSIDEAMHNIDKKSTKPKAVITFDDGYANNYTIAYPILKEFNLPATIFLVSSMIDTNNLFWYDRLRTSLIDNMDWKEIDNIVQSYKSYHPHTIDDMVNEFIAGYRHGRQQHINDAYGILTRYQIDEMQSSGLITFDSHTHRHEILTCLKNNKEVEETIGTSLEVLRGYGIECGNVFCYPNGLYNPKHFEVLNKLGFNGATTTNYKLTWENTLHRYEIPRMGISQQLNVVEFDVILSGLLRKLGKIKQKFSFSPIKGI